MFKVIRKSKVTKFICLYLVFQFFLEFSGSTYAYALTEGPSQPEFNSFTPISSNDMVDLSSGDFSYNIPIMDVGGYPINLAYNSGVTMDQEASWVGLGWNLNIGQINRNIRGLPDDFNGDEIEYSNNLKPNVTLSVNSYTNPQVFGLLDQAPSNTTSNSSGVTLKAGIESRYNNYTGFSANPSFGLSFDLAGAAKLGVQLSASDEMGATISPSVSFTPIKYKCDSSVGFRTEVSAGISYNSRQGLQNFNLSSSSRVNLLEVSCETGDEVSVNQNNYGSGSGAYNFNKTQFTPNSRTEFVNNQFTFTYSSGVSVAGVQIESGTVASATVQTLKYPVKKVKVYGYENTENATVKDLLDYQRENDLGVFSSSTNLLPQTNYSYDLLSIHSQTLNGTFRPYRSQMGYVFDPYFSDSSSSSNASLEMESGYGTHFGASLYNTSSINYTSVWGTKVTPYLKEKKSDKLDYQTVYYKTVGELSVNSQKSNFLQTKYGNDKPLTLALNLNDAINKFLVKSNVSSSSSSGFTSNTNFNITDLRRDNREFKNKAIQKVTKADAIKLGLNNKYIVVNPFAKNHHTAAYLITDENGTRHIFGETVYNIDKDETTFATDSGPSNVNVKKGLVTYSSSENSMSNTSGIDHYFNNIKTGPYAHTYLLTSILSSDYQDLTENGITDDDLGTYVKFQYTQNNDQEYSSNYKWRVPFEENMASYSEGLKTDKKDQKGSYLYGVKEIKYIKRIETKTHVALFDFEIRKDGYGVKGKNGGLDNSMKTYCLKSIRLYSKSTVPFYPDNNVPSSIKPIKTAHFEYDYSLCQGIPNNIDNVNVPDNQMTEGKLTLKKVYFTYQNSSLGQYTPYKFNYGKVDNNQVVNERYAPKDYDIWGNFKNNPTTANQLSNQEFPYVEQENRLEQDRLASNWMLNEISLPSGGKIKVTFESDDYQYVQDQRAMRMFKVYGVSENVSDDIKQYLYQGTTFDAKYVVVKLSPELGLDGMSDAEVIKRCSQGLVGKPIYFDFFLNMADSRYDHITGYFDMNSQPKIKTVNGEKLLYIEMKPVKREGSGTSSTDFNPISVTGWFFGRQNLHRQVYDLPEPADGNLNLLDMVPSLINNIANMIMIFKGENKKLRDKGCAKFFESNKSWIRLNEPTYSKVGGGSRVKKVEIFDEWDKMMNVASNSSDIQRYSKKYGQEYTYTLKDGTSSGVATFEPNMSKENPLVGPFYFEAEKRTMKKYCETPIGASFFPSPTVTYSRVSVKNITAADDDNGDEIRKTKTGTVVSSFYTTSDFPTITDVTPLNESTRYFYSNENSMLKNLLLSSLGVPLHVKNEMVLSQGFQIETNDMNGKLKKQEVYNDKGELISYTEDIYHTDQNNPKKLKNDLVTINSQGKVENKSIGLDYEIVNDLRLNFNSSTTAGLNANSEIIPLGPVWLYLFTGIFDYQKHDQIFKSATTTKVVHRMGILKEKIAFDLGSKVSTKNLAYDSETGNVLLTETQNEFDDHYYSLTYPAYWYYDRMGLASKNIDIEGYIKREKDCDIDYKPYFKVKNSNNVIINNANDYFKIGDELMLMNTATPNAIYERYWVVGESSNGNGLTLMNKHGVYLDNCGTNENEYKFRLIRSGNRNLAGGSMASITLMKNPLTLLDAGGYLPNFKYDVNSQDPYKVLNVSAVEYADFWTSQQEGDLTEYPLVNTTTGWQEETQSNFPFTIGFNPYLHNVNGQFRANKSWAYLTGRNGSNSSIRNQGFLKKYNPFYRLNADHQWEKDTDNWTYASSVSKYSPYGAELENKDALNRYSSAQYGYRYTLPMAIASNSKYSEMGFEGFEESVAIANKHFEFKNSNSTSINNLISSTYSHSGRNSVKVTPTNPVVLKKKLSRNDNKEIMPGCPVVDCDMLIEVSQPIHFLEPNDQNLQINANWSLNEFQDPLGFNSGEIYHRRIRVKSKCGSKLVAGNNIYSNVRFQRVNNSDDELFIIIDGIDQVKQDCYNLSNILQVNVNDSFSRAGDYYIPIYVDSFLTYVDISKALGVQNVTNGQLSPGCGTIICTNSEGLPESCIVIEHGTAKCVDTKP
jgi:hypothetical protein